MTFLVRPARAELLAKNGLRIKSRAGDVKLAAKCIVESQVKPDYDVVMFTAKAYDLPSAIDAIAPAMGQGAAMGRAFVLPLLNGMSHLDALDARFGRARVLGGVAYIASTLAPDGEIQHLNDFQRIVFGPRDAGQKPVCDALSAALKEVKFDWKQLDNVEQAMWDKWVLLATLAGMTCLMRAAVGDIVATGAGEKLILALLARERLGGASRGLRDPGSGHGELPRHADAEGLRVHGVDAARRRNGRPGRGRTHPRRAAGEGPQTRHQRARAGSRHHAPRSLRGAKEARKS